MKRIVAVIVGLFVSVAGIGMVAVLFPLLRSETGTVVNTTNATQYWGLTESVTAGPILIWLFAILTPIGIVFWVLRQRAAGAS